MANKPNNPSLWSKAKSMAKQKFDVYPSAYANGWAAKWYKSHGGTWRKAEYGMEVMDNGGEPQNAGFQALPEYVQNKIMAEAAYGGFMPEYAAGGWAQQAAIAIAMKKAGKKPKSMADGGEPNGEMALGQMAAVSDKMGKLLQFVKPDQNLDPWIASKLAVMDHSADAISDYLMYGPDAQPKMQDGGGIPERYKNMGFSRVGQKKESTSEGKKWMVLAKKGDDYKVVHGGYDGMQDYTQHGSEQRRENFWDRMGGRDSAKAQDPFSPLYWHKRFGTWAEGGELPMAQTGWVQRAANADLNFWEKCGLASSANNGGAGGYYTIVKEGKPIPQFDYMSDLSNDAWFDKDQIKQVRRSRPQGVDEKTWNVLNADARWVTNDFTNRTVWPADKINPKTGRLDDKYLADEWKDKINISNRYRHYSNLFKDRAGAVTAQDLYNYYSAQPGGLEAYKNLINNNYMPQKKDGGNFSGNAYYNNGGFIPMYNVGGMPCYECGGMYQDGGWHSEWSEDAALADQFGYEYQEPAAGQQPMQATSGQMDPWQQYWEETYGSGSAGSAAPAGMTPTTTPVVRKPTYNPSIVDFLNSRGLPSDYATRKEMARELGITNYRGTADQNLQMLSALKNAETNVQTPVPGATPAPGGGGEDQMVYDSATGSWVPTAIALGSVGAIGGLGYYGYRNRMKDGTKAATSAVKSALSGMGKNDMLKAIKDRGYRLSTDYNDLMKAGWKPNEIMKELKGIPFKETADKAKAAAGLKSKAAWTQKLYEQSSKNIVQDAKAAANAYKNRWKNAEPVIAEIEQRGVRSANDMARLRYAGLTQQEAQSALKGYKFADAAPEARSFGQAVREGYAALREAPALGRVAKAARTVGKYLPFEDGGELYMQEGGWNIGDYHVPDWLKTGVQILDPTGISSYGDVYDAWRNPNVSAWTAGAETLAALPVVGKLGKAAKAATKFEKLMQGVEKGMKYVSPVAYMDRKLAPNAAFAAMMANRAAGKAPLTRAVMEIGSLGNQGRRFFTGAGAGIDAMDNVMGYTPKQAEGGMIGQEMEVSPAELKRLKALGYQIEML